MAHISPHHGATDPNAADPIGAARARLVRVETFFHAALARPAHERAAWLESEARGDAGLVAEVRTLLAADHDAAHEDAPRWQSGGCLAELLSASGGPDDRLAEAQLVPQLQPGDRVGVYRVLRLLGVGGMGAVHLAVRDDVGARVALKVVRATTTRADGPVYRDPRAETRFLAERRALARLGHPNVARLLDAGIVQGGPADGAPWFAMEYVDGEPIDVACDRRTLPIRARLALFAEVCGAVAAAHRQLVIHRDLKPSNVFVTAEGRPMLLDFGIAATLDADARTDAALSAACAPPDGAARDTWSEAGWRTDRSSADGLFTPQYAAPEQVRGEAPSVAVDVYALGLLLFEVLTGRRPYELRGRSRAAAARAVLDATIPRPSDVVTAGHDASDRAAARAARPAALRRMLRGDLDAIVLRALARDPAERYATVDALCIDVRRVLAHEPVAARAAAGVSGLLYRTRRLVRRRRAAVALGGAMAAAAAVVTVSAVRDARRVAAERDQARAVATRATRVRDVLIALFNTANPDHAAATTARPSPEAMLRRGEAVADALDGQPDAQADLLTAIGRAWTGLGNPAAAAHVFQRVVEIRRVHRAAHDPLVADALDQYASALGAADRLRAADSVIRLSVAIRQQHVARTPAADTALGGFPATTPRSRARGVAASAVALPNGSAAIAAADSVAELALARTLVRQGQLHYERGQCSTAIPLYQQATAAFARWPGGALAPTRADVAAADSTPRPAAAASLAPEDSAGSEAATLWPALATASLAVCLDQVRAYAAAGPAYRDAFTLLDRYPSAFRLQYAAALNNYGIHLTATGRLAEAEATHRRALAIKRGMLPAQHPSIAASLNSLATVLATMGRAAAAESAYFEGLEMTRATLGATHRRVPVALLGLGIVRWQRGNAAGAADAFGEALRLVRASDPPRPNMVRRTAAGLGTALLALGRAPEAEPLLREAVALDQARRDSTPGPAYTAATPSAYEASEFGGVALRERWAAARARLGRGADAEPARHGAASAP